MTPSTPSTPLSPVPSPEGLPFAYAGGYAPQCGGIHALSRDADGRVHARLAAAVPGSPTWLKLADGGRRLHALLEDGNELATFDVDAADGALTLLSRHATGGALPVHLALDTDAKLGVDVEGGHAWIAHYGDGTLRLAAIGAGGALQTPSAVIAPRPGTAVAPTHAHMVRFHPRWPLMLATDLGRDQLRVWRRGVAAEDLFELDGMAVPTGSGPRHFVFHPREDGQLYLLNEQANALDWLGLDESGRLTHRLRLSSLPAGFEGLSYASDLLIAPDGRRLFALNRLHDSIAVFDLDETGRPAWCGETWAQGSYPRSATFSPDGRELWVCLQRSHQICVFELDGAALPRFDGRFIAMPGAACVVFR